MSASPSSIRRLDEAVVNRIAAGEVIQRPVNAIKEMIENSLDAKSTTIQVVAKQGGLKLIQIQDNGTGIRKEDMAIVCERFTTSKLEKFEDLTSIRTYGFRGEALASISHVAHVTITTRTADSQCAYKAHYSDGQLTSSKPGASAEPKPCAGNKGTQITVEDLFYNIPIRRQALRGGSEEYAKIVDMISKYAIHNSGISFTLKKQGEAVADVRTATGSAYLDNIKLIYGATIARELLDIKHESEKLAFKLSGYVTSANFSTKKFLFVLFINHRLVDCVSLKRGIESVYVAYLPKHSHPFVYLSLEVAPQNVDVNVHPTKHEVHFLHEDAIVEAIQEVIKDRLVNCNESRTFTQRTLKPGSLVSIPSEMTSKAPAKTSTARVYDHHLVRTDSREQTLDAFLPPASCSQEGDLSTEVSQSGGASETRRLAAESTHSRATKTTSQDDKETEVMEVDELPEKSRSPVKRKRDVEEEGGEEKLSGLNQPHRRLIRLRSILNLRQAVMDAEHQGLRQLFQNYKFVGCCTDNMALMQHQTKLYIVNFSRLSKELFYQLLLFDFGNFGSLKLSEPPLISELALLSLEQPDSEWTPENETKEEVAEYVMDLLGSKADMLQDYFSIEITDEGRLVSIPWLLDRYVPDLAGLPSLVMHLAMDVNWTSEEACFKSFSQAVGDFYQFKPTQEQIETEKQKEDSEDEPEDLPRSRCDIVGKGDQGDRVTLSDNEDGWKWIVEHVLFPAFRSILLPSKKLTEDGTIVEVANLPDLYKVFERC
ncbi:DNA mismatch repair protein Mlh1-like isoform X2 [Oscarella lobularis]|uniref:DNA mismatch repair protein Mlh1-like isoform X2 n=1 Tax=Oscarella lobularis TaxID=121494 RepID=UPI0033134220